MDKLFRKRIAEHIDLFEMMQKDEELQREIVHAAELMTESLRNGGTLYLCGNGGSASDAQHIATEFVCRFYKERKAISAEALTTNTSSLTAIGNDYDFESIFVRQLEAKGRQGDVLIGISTSGTSGNVIKAMEYASRNKIRTVLLMGNKESINELSSYDAVIRVSSIDTPRIQEAHIFIGHLLAEYVEKEITGSMNNR